MDNQAAAAEQLRELEAAARQARANLTSAEIYFAKYGTFAYHNKLQAAHGRVKDLENRISRHKRRNRDNWSHPAHECPQCATPEVLADHAAKCCKR